MRREPPRSLARAVVLRPYPPEISASARGQGKPSSSWAFATNWALLIHGLYALCLAAGWQSLAYTWLFPASHLLAWSVFAGSHALVFYYPETMARSNVRGQEHLGPFVILVGHELKHLLPLLLLYAIEGARPETVQGMGSLAATGLICLFALAYFLCIRHDNPYRVSPEHLRKMFAIGMGAGLLAQALFFVGKI